MNCNLRPFTQRETEAFVVNATGHYGGISIANNQGADMPRVITFDKGSKRRLRNIRWSIPEKLSAAALFLLLAGFCIAVALWSASHWLTGADEHWLQIKR